MGFRVHDSTVAEWERKGLIAPREVAAPPLDVSEKDFQAAAVKLAKSRRWKAFHVYDSRKSEPGFPDLVLVRERVLFIELKTTKGVMEPEQEEWFAALKEG